MPLRTSIILYKQINNIRNNLCAIAGAMNAPFRIFLLTISSMCRGFCTGVLSLYWSIWHSPWTSQMVHLLAAPIGSAHVLSTHAHNWQCQIAKVIEKHRYTHAGLLGSSYKNLWQMGCTGEVLLAAIPTATSGNEQAKSPSFLGVRSKILHANFFKAWLPCPFNYYHECNSTQSQCQHLFLRAKSP